MLPAGERHWYEAAVLGASVPDRGRLAVPGASAVIRYDYRGVDRRAVRSVVSQMRRATRSSLTSRSASHRPSSHVRCVCRPSTGRYRSRSIHGPDELCSPGPSAALRCTLRLFEMPGLALVPVLDSALGRNALPVHAGHSIVLDTAGARRLAAGTTTTLRSSPPTVDVGCGDTDSAALEVSPVAPSPAAMIRLDNVPEAPFWTPSSCASPTPPSPCWPHGLAPRCV